MGLSGGLLGVKSEKALPSLATLTVTQTTITAADRKAAATT